MAAGPLHLTVAASAAGAHPAALQRGGAGAFPPSRHWQEMARLAERGGLDALWLGALGEPGLDPLPLLGALISVTRRIGLGAYWGLDRAEPFHVARVFATLDHLSAGRTAWIAGLSGATPEDTPRGQEFIEVTRKLWDSWEDEGLLLDVASGRFADPARVHPIHHVGRFFSVRGPLNVPRPVQGNPPVVMRLPEDESGRRLALAAADVLLLSCTRPEQAMAVRRASMAAGRPPAGLRILVDVMVTLGETETAAQRRAAALDRLIPLRPHAEMQQFVGTPDQLVDHFAAWSETGCCEGFNILPAVLPDDLATLVAEVVPRAQARGLRGSGYAGSTLREHLGLARSRSQYAR